MIGRVGSTLSAWSQPAMRPRARIPIRTQGRITVALPLVAVFARATAELPTAIGRPNDLPAAEPGEEPRVEEPARIADLGTPTGEQLGWSARSG